MTTIPMFPLGSVLLPSAPLPLHIFEDRYRTLIRTCIERPTGFGVTLIAQGHEVGGGDLRTGVGVLAMIEDAIEHDDGRWAVLARGTDRFRVLRWLDDDPHPIAEIELWPDETDLLPSRTRCLEVEQLRSEVAAMAGSLGYRPIGPNQLDALSDLELVPRLVATCPLGESDRYDLLCASDAITRLDLLERRLLDQRVLFGAELAMGQQPPDW